MSRGRRVVLRAPTAEVENGLCPEERFVEQLSASTCSGVLIADDLVLTAAHCLPSPRACPWERLVFGYEACGARTAGLTLDDVYACDAVVWSGEEEPTPLDLALLRLDRRVMYQRAPVRISWRLPAVGEAVLVAGYPDGLPLKLDAGGEVIEVVGTETGAPAMLGLTSDTFAGSSGSPVLSAQGELLGILSQGRPDYVQMPGRSCFSLSRVAYVAPGEASERATSMAAFSGVVARTPWLRSLLTAPSGLRPGL